MLETEKVFDSVMCDSPDQGMDNRVPDSALVARITRFGSQLFVFPQGGGLIVLDQNGTWYGDVAPFCD